MRRMTAAARALIAVPIATLVATGVAAGFLACGGDDGSSGPGACEMLIREVTPGEPVAPATIMARGTLIDDGGLEGLEAYSWAVWIDGNVVAMGSDAGAFSFPVSGPGIYRIELHGSKGGLSCLDAAVDLTVKAPGGIAATYALRVVPGPGQTAAARDSVITVYGGGDSYIGEIVLDRSTTLSGTLRAQDGAGLPGYLRAVSPGGSVAEAFASASGAFTLRVNPGPYDILAIPGDGAIAPRLWTGIQAPENGTFLDIEPGTAVSGTVLDSAGQPVVGARVALRMASVPSTIATTAVDGSFSVLARPGSTLALTVVPPDALGLPTLDVASRDDLASAAGALVIQYAAGLGARSFTVDLRQSDGVLVAPAGSRVTWIAHAITSAATVTRGAVTAPAMGTARRSGVTDAIGQTTRVTLPEATYDVVVEPAPLSGPDQSTAVLPVTVASNLPDPLVLSLARPVVVTGRVDAAAGQPLAGIRVTAAPAGVLASASVATISTDSAADGTFSLSLATSAEYELLLTSRDAHPVRLYQSITTPSMPALALTPLAMPGTVRVTGKVLLSGPKLPAAGAHVELRCHGCSPASASRPLAEATVERDGAFTLEIADPGVLSGLRLRSQNDGLNAR